MQEPTPSATVSEELLLQPTRLGPALCLEAGRVRVRVAAAFLVLAAAPGIAGGARRMALCALLVSFTVLVHELGHALTALALGHRATIVLYALGAHTTCEPKPTRGREVAIGLAGPAVSLLVGAGAFALARVLEHESLKIMAFSSLGWGAINLLPLIPFDAGRALLACVRERRRALLLSVSCVLAGAVALDGLLVARSALVVLLFGVAAGANAIAWAHQRRLDRERTFDLPAQLTLARRLLEQGEHEHARRLATRIGFRACTKTTANAAWELVAWAELALGLPERAYGSLSRVHPLADVDDYALAAVTAALGRTRHAIGLLERSLSRAPRAGAVKLLIDLHARLGAFDRACETAAIWLAVLDPADALKVVEAATLAGAVEPARRLTSALTQRSSVTLGAPPREANRARVR